ncbi:hybrid sensor histidine kinase/response regulator [Catenovulum maritimum]|uniref:hybrid sensor histidine kinase/response regulator n=1 Tax=Catenovulum maritimum TaxID=1513271 RepID=UPI00069E928F|nr:hybrid sensor histidine kinase/response regulator [Catenovulum maritimum]
MSDNVNAKVKAKDKNYTSIKHTLILWFLILSIAPLILVSWLNFQSASQDLVKAASSQLENTSRLSIQFIKNWFDYRFMDLEAQAESETNTRFLIELKQMLEQENTSPPDFVESYSWTKLTHKLGSDLVKYNYNYDYVYDLFLIDDNGNILFTVVKESDLGQSLLSSPELATSGLSQAYRYSLTTGKPAFSGIERYAPSNGELAGFITAPIINDNAEIIGVFAIQLRLDRIFNLLINHRENNNQINYYLINEQGLLYTPINTNNWNQVLSSQVLTPPIRQWQTALQSNQILNHENIRTNTYIGPDSTPVIGTLHPIKIANQNWALISEVNEDIALAPAKNLAYLGILLLFITSLLVVIVAIYRAKNITQPLSKLAKASMRVASGETNQQVEIIENNEIGKLAYAFNHMLTVRKQHEEELVLAKDKAEIAAQAKGDFLATMSHEIRTPMNGILGMLSLLLHDNLNEKQKHYAKLAKASGESLLTIINDILDFSKVDAGKLELENLDFNLRREIGDFSELMSFKAQEQGLELILDLTHIEQSMVKGDPGRLKQILTNLVGNALKFTEKGEIVIRASTKAINDSELSFHCSIQDTGIGINPDKTSSLFDSFTQVDASTTRKYGGTGLGLAIVKKLCLLMNGDISVTSQKGQGTCFTFHLKLGVSEQSEYVLPKFDIKQKHILIVDDNQTNLAVLQGQLENWGAIVTQASSADSALNLLDQTEYAEQFEVALLDMQMPVMDGAELGTIIRQNKNLDHIKLIMMTSLDRPGDPELFGEIGFNAYFTKPATTSDLLDSLAVVLSGGKVLEKATPLVTHNYLKSLKRADEATQDNQVNWRENKRLLLVEDNFINQTVALNLLENMQLNCDLAGDGVEALKALSDSELSQEYDLILMDCQMPEMDGYEATQHIRKGSAGEQFKNIPIIAMTANAMVGDKQKCLNAGMTDYLSKPIDPQALEKMIEKWLR